MVLLRLTVVVPPRDYLNPGLPTLDSVVVERDDDVGSTGRNIAGGNNGGTKFLLVVDNAEGMTVSQLASEIQKKWQKLRPGAS